jgi:hypothetical protein
LSDIKHAKKFGGQLYLLLLHIKGFPGREWAVGELGDRRRVEVHLLAAGETILTRLAEVHRAELRALHGVFTVPHLP